MKEPAWVQREECLAIHEMMLSQYGGLSGVRDAGLLDSALSKPRNLFAYQKPKLTEMAASYAADGRLSDAVATAEQAKLLAKNNPALIQSLDQELNCYRNAAFPLGSTDQETR